MKSSLRRNLNKILKKNYNLLNKISNKKWLKRNFKIWKENYLKQIKIDKNSSYQKKNLKKLPNK